MTTAAVQGATLQESADNLSVRLNDSNSTKPSGRDNDVARVHVLNRSNSAPVTSGDAYNDVTATTSNTLDDVGILNGPSATVGQHGTFRIPDSAVNPRLSYPSDGIFEVSTMQPPCDDVIDSALLAALRDPRERIGLLRLEKAMIDFMNTSDGYIEVGGPYNSVVISPTGGVVAGANVTTDRPQTTFQRCILHRLADRFAIVRESGTLVDGYIRLVKLKESKTPRKLLLHLDSSEYNPPVDETARSMEHLTLSGQSASNGSYNTNGASSNNKPRQRKMKIMKRNSSTSSSGSTKNSGGGDNRSTPRKGKNLSDREKAYAEARARIFSDQQADGGGVNNGTPVAAAPSHTITPPAPSRNSYNSLEDCASEENDELQKARSRQSNSAVSKATWRNRRQEENDPDFQRGGAVVVQQPYGADVYAGYSGGGTAYPQHSSQPTSFYPAYPDDSAAYYAVGHAQQSSQQQPYYGNQGRGRGRGFGAGPRYSYGTNNYYPQVHQHQYNQGRGSQAQPANVNSLDEFPSLR